MAKDMLLQSDTNCAMFDLANIPISTEREFIMSKNKSSIKETKSLVKTISVAGTILSVCAVVIGALGSCCVAKFLRFLHTAQKTLPTIEKAARIYIQEHTPAEEKQPSEPSMSFKSFTFPKKK